MKYNNNLPWVITDLDGTLLDYDFDSHRHVIAPEASEALNQYAAANGKFTFATGRHLLDALAVLKELKLTNKTKYVIGLNGSLVYDTELSQVINRVTLEQDTLDQIIAYADQLEKNKQDFLLYLYTDHTDIILYDGIYKDAKLHEKFKNFENYYVDFQYPKRKEILAKDKYFKAIFFFPQPLENISEEVNKLNQIITNADLSFTSNDTFEINPKLVNKAQALKYICNHDQQYSLLDSVSIGDSGNDVCMFNITNQSYTLKSSPLTVQDAATTVLDTKPSIIVADVISLLLNS